MRCECCNRNLNDYEATLKSATTGAYLDTCRKCLDGLGIAMVGRGDLKPNEQAPHDLEAMADVLLEEYPEE
jgi:hypothetical protein